MKCLVVLLALLLSSASAQVVGRLSYTEPDAAPDIVTRGDLRRLPTGFVEVLHDARLEQCKRQNYERCSAYEWSVPFMPESVAQKVERGLSEAWNRFDARTYWRINTAINGDGAYWWNCINARYNYDGILGIWDRNTSVYLPSSEFCDDLSPEYGLWIPTFCSSMDALTRWDRIATIFAQAYAHAMTHYYLDYWKDVLEVILKNMPLALWWDGVYPVLPGQTSGLVLQPIIGLPNPQQYLELAREAQSRDLRGFAYVLARYPFLNLLGNAVTNQVQELVRRYPIEPEQDGEPGLQNLEPLKAGLSRREGIFSRSNQWATYPWLFSSDGPEPKGSSGAATQYEYAGVGHAVFFAAQSKFILEFSPRIPIFWRMCFTESFPPIPIPIPVPMPMVHAVSRVDTQWLSVPEGYPIPGVKGVPPF
jgi:hypothetical protein